MKIIIQLLLFLFCFDVLIAQTPDIEWQHTIGGSESDKLRAIIQTSDGGYLLGGSSASGISADKTEPSIGSYDYWVVKLDATGTIVWQNTIGGSEAENLYSVIQTNDGGYLLGGESRSGISGDKNEPSRGGYDYWVVKLDAAGEIAWQKTIGGSERDELQSIIQTSDGGFLLGGSSKSGISGDKNEYSQGGYDYWVVKLDFDGTIAWQNTIGGSNDDLLYSIIQTNDGKYLLGGASESGVSGDKFESCAGSFDYWVVQLFSYGGIEWQKTIGGNGYDMLQSLLELDDGGYLLGGYSESDESGNKDEPNLGGFDYWVLKLDDNGNTIWQNTVGGSSDDELHSVAQSADGGYLLGGLSSSGVSGDKNSPSLGSSDYWVVQLTGSGALVRQNTVGGNNYDRLNSVLQTGDSGYLLGGYSESDESGNKDEPNLGGYDYWVVKLNTLKTPIQTECNWAYVSFFPIPTNGTFFLEISIEKSEDAFVTIFSPVGEQVYEMSFYLSLGTTFQQIQLSENLPNGLYLLNIQTDTHVFSEQIILQR